MNEFSVQSLAIALITLFGLLTLILFHMYAIAGLIAIIGGLAHLQLTVKYFHFQDARTRGDV